MGIENYQSRIGGFSQPDALHLSVHELHHRCRLQFRPDFHRMDEEDGHRRRWPDPGSNPTITLPGGFTDGGMPLAFQFLAGHFAEDLLCRAGFAYQQARLASSASPSRLIRRSGFQSFERSHPEVHAVRGTSGARVTFTWV
jgi:hypothetical protein